VNLVYFAQVKEGAWSLITSWKQGLPIRVFRTSEGSSEFRAVAPDKKQRYRYDGLYKVANVGYFPQESTGIDDVACTQQGSQARVIREFQSEKQLTEEAKTLVFCFVLKRIEKGSSTQTNLLSDEESVSNSIRLSTMSHSAANAFQLAFSCEPDSPSPDWNT
jgi:hypothetical protein